jgi:O-antigen/teichoic acid export membrane protein
VSISAPIDRSSPVSQELRVAGRNAVTLGGSLLLTWGVAFLVQFQLPRVLGPGAFGIFNFADAFSATVFTLAQLGIDTYIVREVTIRPDHASEFAGGVLAVRLLAGLVLLGLMYLALTITHRPLEVRLTVLVFGAAQLAILNNNSLAALLQASTRVGKLAVANVAAKVVWGIGLTVLVYEHAPLPVLVLPLLIAELLKTGVLLPSVRRAVGLRFRLDTAGTLAVLLASLPYFVNGGAVNLGARFTAAALEFVTSDKREVGWYGATANLAGLAMLLSPLVIWVMMPLLARARARSEEEAYAILRRTIEGLMVIIIPITLVISLGANLWVRIAFGPRFMESAASLQVLAFDFVLVYMAMILSSMLILVGRHWAVTIVSLSAIPLRALLIVPFTHLGADMLGPGGAAVGAALTEIAGIGLTAGLSLWLVGRRAFDPRSLSAIGKSLTIAAVVVWLDHMLIPFGMARLIVDMAVYLTLVFAVGAVRVADVTDVARLLGLDPRSRREKL